MTPFLLLRLALLTALLGVTSGIAVMAQAPRAPAGPKASEGAKYAIGTLVTTQGAQFRTYFFVKQNSSGEFIQELRFEKQ